jgi:hypothetical protein
MQQGDWQTLDIPISTAANMDKIRLCFAPKEANTTIWVDDVSLHIVEKESSVYPLIPSVEARLPKLDGKLDEDFWQLALVLDDFRVLGQPNRKSVPGITVRLAIANNTLWIAYEMVEPNPEGIRAEIDKPHDIAIHNDDCAETFFSFDRKNIMQMDVNTLGRYASGGREPLAPPVQNWYDHVDPTELLGWQANAARTATGWSVEMAVPIVPLIGSYTPESSKQGYPIVYANFGRHRNQDKENPYANWARLLGNTFFSAEQLKPFVLQWKIPQDTPRAEKTSRDDMTYRATWPDQMMVGEPVLAQWDSQCNVSLPSALIWDPVGITVDQIVKDIVEPCIVNSSGDGKWRIVCRLWDREQIPRQVTDEQAKRLNSKEAFSLNIQSDHIEVSGRTHQAVMRGLATLALLCRNAQSQGGSEIRAGIILDAPVLPTRGWLLSDRTPEQIVRSAKILFLLRYNIVMFDVTGYGLDARFPFDSHPNISDRSTTKKQWADAANALRAMGMTPLPMAMVWSRCGYIANKSEYNYLAVRPDLPGGATHNSRFNKNLSAAHEESFSLVFDLLDELIQTMKVKNIHIALDEIFFDDLVTDTLSKEQGLTRADWLVRVVNRTHDHLKKRGVRTWMWADCLNPYMNARQMGIPVSQLLDKIPKDVVMHDWLYGPDGPYESLKMFKDAGFPTISGSWYRISNVINLVSDTFRYSADGFIGTSWGNSSPGGISAELTTAISLGALVPAELYRTAAYRHSIDNISISSNDPVHIVTSLTSGTDLIEAMGLPSTVLPDVLSKPIKGPLGCRLDPWTSDGQPAAVLVHGDCSELIDIPLQGKAVALAMLHAVNRQSFQGYMQKMYSQYQTTVPIEYVLQYTDGTTAKCSVKFRRQINAWDDRYAAAEAWPGIFGTIGHSYHLNIPAMLCINPHPEKTLKSLQVHSGNLKGMDVALFALTLLRP